MQTCGHELATEDFLTPFPNGREICRVCFHEDALWARDQRILMNRGDISEAQYEQVCAERFLLPQKHSDEQEI